MLDGQPAARARAALLGLAFVAFAAAATVSLLWWRNDADLCLCEYCPDGYCDYAERILAALRRPTPEVLATLAQFGRDYTHGHSPLAPLLQAVTARVLGLSRIMPAFVLVNLGAGLLAWHALRRSVERVCSPPPAVVAALFVGFFGHVLVLRSLARPSTDMVGLACVICSLHALARHVDERTAWSGLELLAWQVVSLFARVSCIPLLGIPAVTELAGEGPLAKRLRRAVRAGLVFGLAPGLAFLATTRSLGIEHLDAAWRFAHQPGFVADYTLGNFLDGLAVAGQGWLLCAVVTLALRRRARSRPVLAVHVSWIVMYLAFLAAGGTAFWPRYFLPVVPSLLVVSAPFLTAAQRARRLAAPAVTALALGLNALAFAHVSILSGLEPPARLLWADLRAELFGRARLPRVALQEQPALRIAANVAKQTAPLAGDRDLDTRWKAPGWQQRGVELTVELDRPIDVAGLSLLTTCRTFPSSLVIASSLDGRLWSPVAWVEGARALRGFFEEKPRVFVELPAQPTRFLSLRLLEAAPQPWSVNEVAVHVPRKRGAPPLGAAEGEMPAAAAEVW